MKCKIGGLYVLNDHTWGISGAGEGSTVRVVCLSPAGAAGCVLERNYDAGRQYYYHDADVYALSQEEVAYEISAPQAADPSCEQTAAPAFTRAELEMLWSAYVQLGGGVSTQRLAEQYLTLRDRK